ncbi:MAG: ribosome-associated translation inhibitor RaiA, partial [Cyanobacteria bacterium P01_F01_bin.4]
MKLVIQGKNIDITDSIRSYVSQKIEKAINHYQHLINKVDVSLSVSRNPRITLNQSAEVTIYVNQAVVRAEESSDSLYASIDLVTDKISRQLKRYKDKRRNLEHVSVRATEPSLDVPETTTNVSELLTHKEPQLPPEVVRTKYFTMPPMHIETALEQLALVDHDFYMFLNVETDEINVIYERNHGGYGIIQPRPAHSIESDNTHHRTRHPKASVHSSDSAV